MVVKIYISGISGNKEVKKRQQRVQLILDSKTVKYDVIDIAEPENEQQKDFMQNNSTSNGGTISDPNPRHPLPPQIYNDDVYCGDYDQFDMANEIDEMEKFLKLAPDDTAPTLTSNANIKFGNGEIPPSDVPNEIEKTEETEAKDENQDQKEAVKNNEDNKNGEISEDKAEKVEENGADVTENKADAPEDKSEDNANEEAEVE